MPKDADLINEIHNDAYSDFMRAVLDASQRDAAKQNPLVGGILSKLSDADLDILARVAKNQTLTNHGPALRVSDDT